MLVISIYSLRFPGAQKKYRRRFAQRAYMKITALVLWGREETGGSRWSSHVASSPSLLSNKRFLSPVLQLKSESMAGTGCTRGQKSIWVQNNNNPIGICNGRDLTVYSVHWLEQQPQRKLCKYQISPTDGCWTDACRDANHEILTGLPSRLTKSKNL